MNTLSSVCVYGASSTRIDKVYYDDAGELGTLLGQRGLRVINGAGNRGLMCALSDAALAASLFHYRELTVGQVKEHLRECGIPVRMDK